MSTLYANNPFSIEVFASDPDQFPNTGLTYHWTQVSGPAQASFTDIYALSPNITCPSAGNYSFQIAVSDSISSTSASISVTVLPFYLSNQSFTAVCPSGAIGTSVVRAAVYTSIVSQPDADFKALSAASIAANAALQCSSTPAVWTLRLAQAVAPAETLTYNLYLLNSGFAANPKNATLLRSYVIDGVNYHAGDTIDYSSTVNAYSGEQIFLWQLGYKVTVSGSGSGTHSITRAYPLTYEVLSQDPSYVNVGKAYTKELPVTSNLALIANTTYIDAPNVAQTNISIQHDFSSPPKSRLWVYNWDQRLAAAGATTYDYLRVSWLSSGLLTAPITETVLLEQSFAALTYGANMFDDDANYLSLDAAVAALPNGGGNLIVRRGIFNATSQEIVYGADSTVLTAFAVASTGTVTLATLNGNTNIPENINGAVTLSSNSTIVHARMRVGTFAIRQLNWRDPSNANYNSLVVYQLIGPPGAFTGTAAHYGFAMNTPDSPCGFFEIPLPTNANGTSFAVYAATQSGTNIYTLYPDSFPMSTSPAFFEDVWKDNVLSPYTVTSLAAGTIAGLPSALNSVFTVQDNTRSVILKRFS